MSFKVTIGDYNSLSDSEKAVFISCQDANFLRVIHDHATIILECDAMEPEDALFTRDLSWVAHVIREAYTYGFSDALHNDYL
jgi:hypothetical protein